MSLCSSDDSLDFLLSCHNEENFWLTSSSILITPPDSVEDVSGSQSQEDYKSLPSVSNSNTFAEDDNTFLDWNYEHDSDEESDSESYADLNFHTTSLQELRILTDLHKFVENHARKLDDQIIDFFVGITNEEWEIMEKLEELKENLFNLTQLENHLVQGEIERISKKILPLKEEKVVVETLRHVGDINPVVYNPLTSTFLQCRIARPLEMSPEVQYGFRTSILTSVVLQKLSRTNARFEGLLFEAGATQEQLAWLRHHGYQKSNFSDLVVRTPKLQYSTVSPVVQAWYSPDGNIQAVARSLMTVFDLYKWKINADEIDKQTTLDEIFTGTKIRIDWMHVSKIMLNDFKYEIEPHQCEALWKCVLNPANDNFPWTQQTLRRLQEIVRVFGEQNWDKVAICMGHEVTPFMCFVMYTNFVQSNFPKVLESQYEWSLHEKQVVVNEICQGGNYGTAAVALNNYFPDQDYNTFSARICHETTLKYKKVTYETVSPVEDAILLVTMEKFSDLVIHPQIAWPGPLPIGKMLSWRSNKVWTRRLRVLFDEWVLPWTVQDELKLLYLAKEFNKDWTLVAREFDGTHSRYRSRTVVRSHHARLISILNKTTYIEYRRDYQETKQREDVQYLSLRRAYNVILGLRSETLKGKLRPFRGLSRNYPPNDVDLAECLQSLGQDWISYAIHRLEQFLQVTNSGDDSILDALRPKVLDRRTFHREDPKSVASALHIRRLQVKPFLEFNELSQFEQMVVFHLDFFYKNTTSKLSANRQNIPTASQLRSLPELSRILIRPVFEMIEGQKVKDYLPVTPARVKNVDHFKSKSVPKCGSTLHSTDVVPKIESTATSSQPCADPPDSLRADRSVQAEIKLVHTPKLTESKGNKKARLSNIRRLIAKRRWLNRSRIPPTEQSVMNPVIRKQRKGIFFVPLEDLQELDREVSLENRNATPPVPIPISPLKELKRNVYLFPTTSPQKRPKRDTKTPNKIGA